MNNLIQTLGVLLIATLRLVFFRIILVLGYLVLYPILGIFKLNEKYCNWKNNAL